jgi:hypothetical protein
MCPNCQDNLRRNAAKVTTPRGRALLAGCPPPTVAGLERHARRFGPARVPETAAQLGLTASAEREPPVRKVGRPPLRQRDKALVDAGHGVVVIAEIDDLTPCRARRFVKEVS